MLIYDWFFFLIPFDLDIQKKEEAGKHTCIQRSFADIVNKIQYHTNPPSKVLTPDPCSFLSLDLDLECLPSDDLRCFTDGESDLDLDFSFTIGDFDLDLLLLTGVGDLDLEHDLDECCSVGEADLDLLPETS